MGIIIRKAQAKLQHHLTCHVQQQADFSVPNPHQCQCKAAHLVPGCSYAKG